MKQQLKSHQSSGSRFIQRHEVGIDVQLISKDSNQQYHSRTQSGGQNNQVNLQKQNQSFDFTYNNKHEQYKSLNLKENNILDDLNDDQSDNLNVNITLGRTSMSNDQGNNTFNQSEQQLNYELQRVLSKSTQGQNVSLSVDDLTKIITSIQNCMYESAQELANKEEEIQILRKEINAKDQLLHQQRSTLLSVQNEISEQKHMRNHPIESPQQYVDEVNIRLAMLEQENEMLQIENKQAIKLAIQNRNKRGEKELGEYITRIKNNDNKSSGVKANNYSTILNAQFNRSLHERKNSNKGSSNKSFNLF